MHSLTTFSLIKRQLDQSPIRKVIKTHNADKHSKGFDTYRHLLAMLFAQLTDCKSLRELEITLNSHHSKHYHLGMSTVQRSTLSYANKHRSVVFLKLLISYGYPKIISIDKHADNNVMHGFRF